MVDVIAAVGGFCNPRFDVPDSKWLLGSGRITNLNAIELIEIK